jgi:hypothetical protein
MSVESKSLVIPATGTLDLEPANTFFLVSASAAVNINFNIGTTEGFTNFLTGLKVERVKNWRKCTIVGVQGTTVLLFYGISSHRDDSTELLQTLATISGTVNTFPAVGAANAVTDHADVTFSGATDTTIGANVARRWITIGGLSTNTASLRVRAHSSAAGGAELQPGSSLTYYNINAFDVINASGVNQTYWWQEQT